MSLRRLLDFGGFGFPLVVGGFAFALGASLFSPSPRAGDEDVGETLRRLDLFGAAFDRIRADYVEPPDDGALVEAAIEGMLTSLDPHSSYMNAERFREMKVQTRGEFGGLGIEVTMEDGVVKVVAPLDDTPAARADMRSGDLIIRIDGEPVRGLSLSEAVDLMRGEKGTPIELTVAREGRDEPFDVTIVRDIIRIVSVRSELLDDVGYVRITTFNRHTYDGVLEALESLPREARESDREFKGFVLDLRNNPGGLLDQAIAVADSFISRGEIVSTRGRTEAETSRYNASGEDESGGFPLAALINGGSASASEIVAGALQDHERAAVIGTPSFGKGSVQTVIPLGEDGAIRLTTALYYTPSGRSIQALGIDPDVEIEQAPPDDERLARAMERSSRGEADLRGHIVNEDVEDSESVGVVEGVEGVEDLDSEVESEASEDSVDSEDSDSDSEGRRRLLSWVPKEKEKDAQLQYALRLLRGEASLEDDVAAASSAALDDGDSASR